MDLKQFFNETVFDDVPYRRPRNFKYSVLSPLLGDDKSIDRTSLFSDGTLKLEGNEIPIKIAVKRSYKSASGVVQLSAVMNGAEELLAVMKSVGQMHHRNVERLLGWCDEQGELLFVYNYMPNGSLSDHLTKPYDPVQLQLKRPYLPWTRRLKILCGVTRALAYLHEGWEQRVIHRDVKPSNIMLDKDFNAHLCNFDLALFCEHDRVQPSSERLQGTPAYMDPHYIRTSKATEKSDVYSFGITLLELATGRKPETSTSGSKFVLVNWVRYLYRYNDLLRAADFRLDNLYDHGEMRLLLKLGLLCCNPEPYERPDITDVINICKGSIPFPEFLSTIYDKSPDEVYYHTFEKEHDTLTNDSYISPTGIPGSPVRRLHNPRSARLN